MDRSTPGLPVHHQLLEFTQTHVHRHMMCFSPPTYVCIGTNGDMSQPHVAATLKYMAAATTAVASVNDRFHQNIVTLALMPKSIA